MSKSEVASLRNGIALFNIDFVFQELLTKHAKQSQPLNDETILLSSRWNDLKSQTNKGIISQENYTLEKNKIIHSLINIINILDNTIKNDTNEISLQEDEIIEDIITENTTNEYNQVTNPKEKFGEINVDESKQLERIIDSRKLYRMIRRSSIIQISAKNEKDEHLMKALNILLDGVNSVRNRPSTSNESEFEENVLDNVEKIDSALDFAKNHGINIYGNVIRTKSEIVDKRDKMPFLDWVPFAVTVASALTGSLFGALFGDIIASTVLSKKFLELLLTKNRLSIVITNNVDPSIIIDESSEFLNL